VQREGCGFVLYTELVDVQPIGTARVGTTPPGAIGTGVTIGKIDEPPEMRRELNDATVNYRIVVVEIPRRGRPVSSLLKILLPKMRSYRG